MSLALSLGVARVIVLTARVKVGIGILFSTQWVVSHKFKTPPNFARTAKLFVFIHLLTTTIRVGKRRRDRQTYMNFSNDFNCSVPTDFLIYFFRRVIFGNNIEFYLVVKIGHGQFHSSSCACRTTHALHCSRRNRQRNRERIKSIISLTTKERQYRHLMRAKTGHYENGRQEKEGEKSTKRK